MGKATILLISVIFALSGSTTNSRRSDLPGTQPQESERALADQPSAIHLTIATVAPMLGPPTNRYRMGEQVPITIGMTNTSNQPTEACVSSDLYQDLPKLTKNGRLIPYAKWQTDMLHDAKADQTCQHDDLPETILLRANEPAVVDFLILVDDNQLSTGALSWYDPLSPGVYELSIQRRLGCCDGPMIESNKISFEVVP